MSKRHTTIEQINDIIETVTYQSGELFSLPDMVHRCTKVRCKHRMNTVLTEMVDMGLLEKLRINNVVRFKKPMAKLLSKRWISEVAEDICCRNLARGVTGQAARDAFIRARKLETSSATSCGGSL